MSAKRVALLAGTCASRRHIARNRGFPRRSDEGPRGLSVCLPDQSADCSRQSFKANSRAWQEELAARPRAYLLAHARRSWAPHEALRERPWSALRVGGVMTTLERASQPGLLDLWRNSRKGRAVLALWVGVAASVSAQAFLQKRRKARKRKESRLQKETNKLENQHVQPEAKALLSESPKASIADAPQEGKGEAEENKERVGAQNGKGENVESDDKKQDVRVLLRLLRKDRNTLGLSGLVASAVVLRLLVSIKVSRKIGSLGSLLAQRKWKELANAQMDFALWTIPAALLNAFVEYAQSLLALAIQKRLLHEVHQRFAEPRVLGRAADTLGDQDQRAASDTARLAEEAATLVQSSFKPLAETVILSATLARLMGVRPLLTCYAYFALAGSWSRMVAPSLTSLQDRVQREEGAFRAAHSRLKEYVQEVQFARGEAVEAARLEDLFRSVARTKTLHGAQRFASGALDGYAVRYTGILAALAMMTPALSNPGRNVEDPTEFFLTCLHLLVNLMSAFKDIALAFRALSAVRALASRVNALLAVGHGNTHPVKTLAKTPAGQAAVERQALEKLSRGEDTGKIVVDRITITASGVEILHKFSCTFQQGESVFVRGHNGAGKTSLLRILRGMWSPAAGTVACNVPASALLFMTQRPYFLQGASLREQLLYPQRSGDAIVDDDVLLEAISRVGLESVVTQPAISSLDQEFSTDGLSAGEAQRLACARVLVRRPVFCFADECTGSCTEAFETAFFTHCIEDLGITMITVSHRSAIQSLHARVLDLSDTTASHVSPNVEKNEIFA